MKYYSISFPGECGQDVVETWSEKQILSSGWYRNWVMMMVQGDKAHLIHDQSAIDDWCVTHWAIEVEKPGWIKEGVERNTDKGYEIGTMEEAQKFSENRKLDLEKNFVDALVAPENKK